MDQSKKGVKMMKKQKKFYQLICIALSILCLPALLGSCKTSETSLKSNSKTMIDTKEQVLDHAQNQKSVSIKKLEAESIINQIQWVSVEDQTISQHIIDYDTDKPIDPTSGKLPILRETYKKLIQTKKTDQNRQSQAKKERKTEISLKEKINRLSEIRSGRLEKQLAHSAKVSKPILNTKWLLLLFGLLVFSCFCYGFYKRIKK